MGPTAISLQLRTNKIRAIQNPSFIQLFSSSSTPESPINAEDQNTTSSPSQSRSSFSSYFSDVKASLKQDQSHPQLSPRKPFSFSSNPLPSEKPSKIASSEEIRKNLVEYRRRSAVPPPRVFDSSSSSFPPPPQSPQRTSFQELYKRNVIPKNEESNTTGFPKSEKFYFGAIRESLDQLRMNRPEGVNKGNETMSRSKFTDDFLRPANSAPLFLRTDSLPSSVFGNETEKMSESPTMKTEFVRIYSYGQLGEMLRNLRPEKANKGEKWFSLGELNERLVKLREMEEKESESRIGGFDYIKELRGSLLKLQLSDNERVKKKSIHRLDILGQLDGTTNFMLSPPKENLVEKYFHPDNMSSSEKMKIELKKVRDEFKMSESDCGSARVQVAQLTTKIKHLSTALHKKDKHSQKGLQAMVQRRKKLLKYMRKTDWDSYCLVLSKLGLRDNPDYKN